MTKVMQSKIFKFRYALIMAFLIIFLITSCSSSEDGYTEIPQLKVVIGNSPHEKLSDYNFFKGDIKLQDPSNELLPFAPISTLFTDYAKKRRFIYMPNNVKASYVADNESLNFPVGAAIIKTFYYDAVLPDNTARIIETRVMIKKSTGWMFAEYVWNDQQTEAYLQMNGSTTAISFKHNGVIQNINYEIPSENQCATCHNSGDQPLPIGTKPQNLDNLYTYADGSKNQLTKWIDKGFLTANVPSNIMSVVDYNDTTKGLNLRARSYFDINCAHCHHAEGSANYVNLRFAFSDSSDLDNLGVNQGAGIPVPGVSHGVIVAPQNAPESSLYYMMSTNDPMVKMPRLGRTIVDQEGLALVEAWINSLDN